MISGRHFDKLCSETGMSDYETSSADDMDIDLFENNLRTGNQCRKCDIPREIRGYYLHELKEQRGLNSR